MTWSVLFGVKVSHVILIFVVFFWRAKFMVDDLIFPDEFLLWGNNFFVIVIFKVKLDIIEWTWRLCSGGFSSDWVLLKQVLISLLIVIHFCHVFSKSWNFLQSFLSHHIFLKLTWTIISSSKVVQNIILTLLILVLDYLLFRFRSWLVEWTKTFLRFQELSVPFLFSIYDSSSFGSDVKFIFELILISNIHSLSR